MKLYKWFLPTLVIGAIGLTACGSSHETNPSSAVGAPSNSDIGNKQSDQSSKSINGNSSNDTSLSQADSQSTGSQATSKDSTSEVANSKKNLISTIMQLAQAGKVINCEFAADVSLMDTIEKSWGKPDKIDATEQGSYATYTQRSTAFGFNKGAQLFDVRSFDNQLKQIAYMDVERVLGKPDDLRSYGDQDILVYNAGSKFQLEWVFAKPNKQEANPSLDHISVFCPKDSGN